MGYNIFEGYVQDSWKFKPRLTLDPGCACRTSGLVRRNGVRHGRLRPRRLQPERGARRAVSGPDLDRARQQRAALRARVQSLFWAPRVGFAWTCSGTGQTLLRGGFGVFNYHDEQAGSQLDRLPAWRDVDQRATRRCRRSGPSSQHAAGSTGAFVADDDKQPRTQSWSLTLQQRLPWSMTFETVVCRQQERPAAERRPRQHQHRPVRRHAQRSQWQSDATGRSRYGDINVIEHRLYRTTTRGRTCSAGRERASASRPRTRSRRRSASAAASRAHHAAAGRPSRLLVRRARQRSPTRV